MATLPPPPPGQTPVTFAPPQRRSRLRLGTLLLAVGIDAWLGGLGGAVLGNQVADWWNSPPGRASDQPIDVAAPRPGFENRLDVARVAEYVAPSTVTVSADIGGGVSLGTGVIISDDGEILTNAHVVDGADEVRVRLMGEFEPRQVTVLAEDAGNDLALLRMSGEGFEAATFADPDSIRLGDDVMAIGFALGLDGEPSVTLGIVSALDRSVGQGDVYLDGLIQTDAAISSGKPIGNDAMDRTNALPPYASCAITKPGRKMTYGILEFRITSSARRLVLLNEVASVSSSPGMETWTSSCGFPVLVILANISCTNSRCTACSLPPCRTPTQFNTMSA